MLRFRLLLLGLFLVTLGTRVWTGDSGNFELYFVTWPNETQAIVNDTVKFMWKYYVKGKDVDIKWGTSKYITPNVATFTKTLFTATNYEVTKKVVLNENIPERYRGRIQIVGQATLQIINVTLEDEGDYLCEISDTGAEWKTLSRAVTLRVLIPPKIEGHPIETILLSEGEELKIGCKASGKPVPSVSWHKDGDELAQGVGSSEYIKADVSRGDAGNYICNARNNASEDQYVVQVIIQYAPVNTKIKTDAKSDTLPEGEDLKIVCEAQSSPDPMFTFYHYMENETRRILHDRKANNGELYIRNIKPFDRGNYACVPKNSVGQGVEARVYVSVLFAPQIVSLLPKYINLTKNDPLSLFCKADGYPKPRIMWSKSEENTRVLSRENVFSKSAVDENDAGVYTCKASNGNPPDASRSVTINVFYKPVIDKLSSSIKVPGQIGHRVELKCSAHGNPSPSFEWKTRRTRRLGFSPKLIIHSLKKEDFGTYICAVSNTKGTTDHQVDLFEIEKPLVTNFQVLSTGARHVYLSWSLAGNMKFPIKRQQLKYGRNNGQKSTIIPITGESKTMYKLEKLVPYSNYVVRVKAWNEYIESDVVEIRFKTNTANPGAPGSPSMKVISHAYLNVSWAPPKEANGKLTEYIMEYSFFNESRWNPVRTPGNVHYKVLKHLKNGYRYKFRVRAATSSGKGKFSSTTDILINVSDVSIPRNPKATQTSTSSYMLEWKQPLRVLGKTVKISVTIEWKMKHSGRYGKEHREISLDKRLISRGRRSSALFEWTAEVTQLSPVRRLELKDLFPNTDYSVFIKEGMKVKTGIHWSGKTQSLGIETPAGVPSQPMNFLVSMLNDTRFVVTWQRPLYAGGELTKYTIFYRDRNEPWKTKELVKDLKNESILATIEKVNTNGIYHVKVHATGRKSGLFSKTVQYTKDSDVLGVSIESHSANSFAVTWTKPARTSAQITKYTIYYKTAEDRIWLSKKVTSGLNNKTLKSTVVGLTAGSSYTVKLQASSSRHVFLSKQHVIEPVTKTGKRSGDDINYGPMFGGIVAGVLIFAFVIIVIAMYIRYNYRKRQRNLRRTTGPTRSTPGVLITRENGHTHMSSPSEHLSTDSPGSEKYLRPERKANPVQVPLKLLGGGTKPIPVANLAEYCKELRKDGNKGLSQEFKSIDDDTNYPHEECKKVVNKAKNRYANIVTYDHSRVVLSNTGDKGSDYIHANYVDGYNSPEKFIATQGPVSTTFNDFWRMVWEQNCSAIVMVTNLIEKSKVKCQKYWPVAEAELFGSLTVNPIEEWELADYTIRKFQLQQNNNSDLIRDITQFHFTTWPDHGVPMHAARLLAFIKRVQNYFRVSMGKIVVHCSAGVGRSGTFIALDALLEQMRAEGVVDVRGFVSHMRTQRSSMVQTEAQYSFIYEAILQASICGDTDIVVPDFEEKVAVLDRMSSGSQGHLFAKEFENINLVSINEKETCVNALIPENKKKNRFNSILPYDSNRVKLWPYPNEKGSDYINASFIDSYRNREIFIATQAPLKDSLEDFWRMTWEYECHVLVMLCNLDEQQMQCRQYWPSEGEEYVVFGLLMIEMECEQEFDTFTKRTLKCTNTKSGEVRKMYHLHYTAWLEHNVAYSSASILNFLREMLKLEQHTGNGLTLVHCSDGSGRVGTLLTIYIALERLKLESIIDLFSIVRHLRTQRVAMVENLEQYRFCYNTLQEYLKSSKYPAMPIS